MEEGVHGFLMSDEEGSLRLLTLTTERNFVFKIALAVITSTAQRSSCPCMSCHFHVQRLGPEAAGQRQLVQGVYPSNVGYGYKRERLHGDAAYQLRAEKYLVLRDSYE